MHFSEHEWNYYALDAGMIYYAAYSIGCYRYCTQAEIGNKMLGHVLGGQQSMQTWQSIPIWRL